MNTYGRMFRVGIFGESHGPCAGVVIDGVIPGIEINRSVFEEDLKRRRPGISGTTSRAEQDIPEIVSGVCNGVATGAPVTVLFRNTDTRPEDYERFKEVPRPGHSDFAASVKYNHYNDMRGSGPFSGRLTVGLVAAGAIAKKIIGGISINAYVKELGGLRDESEWPSALEKARREGDSLGAIVECRCSGVKPGLGEPFFDSVESCISHIVFSIPGVRGIEFGDGFSASAMRGSEHNDPFCGSDGKTSKNGSGGINGGISNGNEILFRVAFKPASSISKMQRTYDFVREEMTVLGISGRHDTCFALRAPVIVESVAAIALADLMLVAG